MIEQGRIQIERKHLHVVDVFFDDLQINQSVIQSSVFYGLSADIVRQSLGVFLGIVGSDPDPGHLQHHVVVDAVACRHDFIRGKRIHLTELQQTETLIHQRSADVSGIAPL